MRKLTVEEYVRALEQMKQNPRDRLGILGELGVTSLGVTAGVAASGAVAAAAGAATLAGSTTLGSILGGIFVTTTPVGWIVGAAVAGGALAYSAGKLVRGGGKCDMLKQVSMRELEQRIHSMRQEALSTPVQDEKMSKVITSIQYLISNAQMGQNKATEILEAIERKRLSVDDAFELLLGIVNEGLETGAFSRWGRKDTG